MSLFDRLNERSRLMLVFGCAAALFLASLLIALKSESDYQARLIDHADVDAHILADTSSAALAFQDSRALSEYVAAFRADKDVVAAGIYDNSGRLLASFGQTPLRAPAPGRGRAHASPDLLTVTTPVAEGGVALGSVFVAERAETLPARAFRYSGAALLALMAGLMFAMLGAYVRALSQANDGLRRQIAEREAVEAALRQSQKMEAVGRLTGGIAHDFNNMLAVISGSLDLLGRRLTGDDPRVTRLLEAAAEGARRAAELTKRLLAFSRRQPLNPKAADVGESARSLSQLLSRALGETVEMQTVVAGGLWPAMIDLPQLESAILNLCVNARDAMPDGGRLTLECGNAFLDRDYCQRHPDVSPGQYVMVAVTDTGSGIAPELLEQVFEPFFTTKPIGLGTGLGLSQVQGFIKQSGGHVAIYSEVGVGTTVKLYLPRSETQPERREAPARVRRADRRNVTVLVVEDDPGVRAFAVDALQELGYDATQASSAAEGLTVLKSSPDVSVLLTDVIMPNMNGRQLSTQALKLRPELKVLFMTGYTQNAIVHNGVLDADARLLSKPFSTAQLEVELDALLTTPRPAGPAAASAPPPSRN